MARFTRIVPFRALDKDTLREILRSNVIDRLTREFDDEGFRLVIDDSVIDHIVGESMRRETGARGLAAILTRHIEDAAFEAFAEQSGGEVRVGLREEKIVVDISG
jgi:ATP-dependent Clp protease ATP-binding subunit ClpA